MEWAKDDAIYKARQGAYVAVDIIEVRAMTQNMVLVRADEMSKAIASSGRVALYGIFFDYQQGGHQAGIQAGPGGNRQAPEAGTDLKLHVVGHTDNVGGLSSTWACPSGGPRQWWPP